MITTQLTSQLAVLSNLSATRIGGNQSLAEEINNKATDYLDEYAQKAADGNSTTGVENNAAQWIDETVTDLVAAKPVDATAESIFAAITSGQPEAVAAFDLNEQLSILSTVTADKVGGDQELADTLNQVAENYLQDYNQKIEEGKSTASLEADAAEWIEVSVRAIALSVAHESLSKELFSVATVGGELDSLDLTGQLSLLSGITADKVGGDQDLTDALNAQALEYIDTYNQKVIEGRSTAGVEEDAAAWIEAAVSEIYMSRAVESFSNELFSEEPPASETESAGSSNSVESSESADASQTAEEMGGSAWERFLARKAEIHDHAMRSVSANSVAMEALRKESGAAILGQSEFAEGDSRLDSMRRALERLRALPDEVANSHVLGLVAKTAEGFSDPATSPENLEIRFGGQKSRPADRSADLPPQTEQILIGWVNPNERSTAASLAYSEALAAMSNPLN